MPDIDRLGISEDLGIREFVPSSAGVSAPADGAGMVRRSRRRSGFEEFLLGGVSLRLSSVVALVAFWYLMSILLSERVLPGPSATVSALWDNYQDGVLGHNTRVTMVRILWGFAVSMVAGVTVGLAMGMSRLAERALDMWVVVALVIPSLCYIIIAFLWLGINERGTILAIGLTAFPLIAINVWSGVKAVDRRLSHMAKAYNAGLWQRVRQVTVPQVMPSIVASARFGFGTVWKIVVIAELMGRSDGIGFQLNYHFQLFNMPQVFAWTLYFTLIMLAIEIIVFKPLEARVFRWRPGASS